MSKRKLTKRQAWRINKIQDERRQRAAARSAAADDALSEDTLGPEQPGLVIAHFGTQVLVEGDAGEQRCHLRANLDSLVTGDRVAWRAGDELGVVVAREPRQAELLRPDPYGKLKPVAANVDQIIVVIAPLPEPHANLIDRYLVAAECIDIEPVILLNKSDLVDAEQRSRLDELLTPYTAIGYRVLEASSRSKDGMAQLKATLAKRTSVFVGQSGVGKSSLVNALIPDADIRVGALSEARDKGTHTTTTARWYHLPDQAAIIDSPGIREFGLWHVDRADVEQGFREFRPLLGRCRFRDCQHQQEPGCALLEAEANGTIAAQRMASYRYIVGEQQKQTS